MMVLGHTSARLVNISEIPEGRESLTQTLSKLLPHNFLLKNINIFHNF